ncbi:MAG: choice-of-anchor B family protein [Nitriliruptorales bacterium]|nr:choice-of-anchor B family protein [Nitriliruptorales bacterium]
MTGTTSTNSHLRAAITSVVMALLLPWVIAPPTASAHPDPLEDAHAKSGADGLGVEVIDGPDGLAEFLSAYQWAGTPTVDDEGTPAHELAYVPGGCTPISYVDADVEGKIALVDQAAADDTNPCMPTTFFQKVQYAQQAGAVGFLHVPTVEARSNATAITADIPALDLIRVTETDADGNEVATQDDAADLRDAVKAGGTVTVRFIDRRPVYETTSDQPCVDGFAGDTPFQCDGVDLLGFISHKEFNSAGISDIWGWTDPGVDDEPGTEDAYEGDEYVIMGKTNGVGFFRVTDPTAPEYLGELPNPGLVQAVWHDIKVFQNHAFIVSESEGHGMTVFDLTRLRDAEDVRGQEGVEPWTSDARYRLTSAAHNLEINEEIGMAYILGGNAGLVAPDHCLSGLHMVDINDPTNPIFRGCYVLEGGPGTAARTAAGVVGGAEGQAIQDNSPAAYVHDAQCVVYGGPDEDHQGKHICVTAAENKIVVVDVTNPAVPTTIGSSVYEHVAYAHQGWFDESQSYWFVNDELAQMTFPEAAPHTRTIVMDLTDLDDPKPAFDYHAPNPVSEGGMKAITHNNYVVGDLLFQSNYASGLRVADISGVADGEMTEVAWFDTYPTDDDTNFDGTWSNYPFFASGTIAVSGRNEGLFLLGLAGEDTTPGVDISCVDCPVEIRSGETGDASLAITNTGDVDDSYDLAVGDLPDGWTATASPDPVSLAAGEAGDATLTIEVPRGARTGSYTLTVTATSGVDPTVGATTDVVVEVVKGKPSQAGRPDGAGPGGDRPGRSADGGRTTAVPAAAETRSPGTAITLLIAVLVLGAARTGSSLVRRRSAR